DHAHLAHAHGLAAAQRRAAVVRIVQVLQHHHEARQARSGDAIDLVAPLVGQVGRERVYHQLRIIHVDDVAQHAKVPRGTTTVGPKMREPELRRLLVEICHRMYRQGYIAAGDGNVSAKLDSTRVLVTPTGLHKGFITEDDLVIV